VTLSPTTAPTTAQPTKAPTTSEPTKAPTTANPTVSPTMQPTASPSKAPVVAPTVPPGRMELSPGKKCADLTWDDCCKYCLSDKFGTVEEGGGCCFPTQEYVFFSRGKASCRSEGWIYKNGDSSRMGTCEA
jgi:hypothetical protein